jgi:hypothetical protein
MWKGQNGYQAFSFMNFSEAIESSSPHDGDDGA